MLDNVVDAKLMEWYGVMGGRMVVFMLFISVMFVGVVISTNARLWKQKKEQRRRPKPAFPKKQDWVVDQWHA